MPDSAWAAWMVMVRSVASAILEAPSVLMPEEPIALVNPLHADAKRMTARIARPFEYNGLIRGA